LGQQRQRLSFCAVIVRGLMPINSAACHHLILSAVAPDRIEIQKQKENAQSEREWTRSQALRARCRWLLSVRVQPRMLRAGVDWRAARFRQSM
jgi:hypothetical protein